MDRDIGTLQPHPSGELRDGTTLAPLGEDVARVESPPSTETEGPCSSL